MTNPQQALGQNAFPLAASDIIGPGLAALAMHELGSGHQLLRAQWLKHLDPGR